MAMFGLFDTTGDASATPSSVDYRRRMAAQLAGQATDASPKGHWAHILAQALQGGVSGYQSAQATADERAGRDAFAAKFQGGKIPDIGVLASDPWAPAGMAGSVLSHKLEAPYKDRALKLQEEAGSRADEMQRWQIAQMIEQMKKPSEMDTALTAVGVPVTPRPAPLMPPLPSWATGSPGATPPRVSMPSGMPMAPPPPSPPRVSMPPAGSLRGPSAGSSPSSAMPSFPSGYALPTDVAGTVVAGPTSGFSPGMAPPPTPPPTPTAPATAPSASATPRTDVPWSGRAGAIAALVASGRLKAEDGRMLMRGPAFAGMTDASMTEHDKRIHAANDAAGVHEAMIGNIEQLKNLMPQAFVGANAETRAAVASQLATLGISHEWLLKNQSLPATQLLQQGIRQFVAIDAPKYKPLSNNDVNFIQTTYPNLGNDPVALANGLQAMYNIALRQKLFETARAQLLERTPYPDIEALRRAVREQVPDHVFDPKLGAAPSAPGAAGGSSGPGGSGMPAVGAIARSTTGGPDLEWNGSAWVPHDPGAAMRSAYPSTPFSGGPTPRSDFRMTPPLAPPPLGRR